MCVCVCVCVCVCARAELILEEATNALSHKMVASRLEKVFVSPQQTSHQNYLQRLFCVTPNNEAAIWHVKLLVKLILREY